MLVSFSSRLTPARKTSTSSRDQPRPFSSLGRVRAARLTEPRPARQFSKVQIPLSMLAGGLSLLRKIQQKNNRMAGDENYDVWMAR